MIGNNTLDKELKRYLEQLELDNTRIKELYQAKIHLYDNYYLLKPTSLKDLVYLLCKYSNFDSKAIAWVVEATTWMAMPSNAPIIAEICEERIKNLMLPHYIQRELKKKLDLIGG